MMEKYFYTFTATSDEALNAKIEAHIRKRGEKEISRSAPSASIAFKNGDSRLEPYTVVAVTSTFLKNVDE